MANSILVLNADYTPINFISWQKAMALVVKGKVEVLKYADELVNSFKRGFKMPLVIRLIKLVRLVYKKEIPFSKRGVFIRDDYTCQYCGKKVHKPTLDHVIPQSKGGKSTWENGVTACQECNAKKADKSLKEAGLFLKSRPVQPTVQEFLNKRYAALNINEILSELFA